jgi:hypothetical protein
MKSPDQSDAQPKSADCGLFLLKDAHWNVIAGRPCKVTGFTPAAKVEGGKVTAFDRSTPYALLGLEARELPPGTTGAITHKLDFKHLWAAFVERGISDDEEVVIFWLKKEGLKGWARLFAPFMPGLVVMVCKAGACELLSDRNCQPELRGEARWLAERPIMQWEPEIYR